MIMLAFFLLSAGFCHCADLRVLNGALYDAKKSTNFVNVHGRIMAVISPGTVVLQEFEERAKVVRLPPRGPLSYGNMLGGSAEEIVTGVEKVMGLKRVVKNIPSPYQIGQDKNFIAARTGTTNLNGEMLMLYDRGTEPTAEILVSARMRYGSLSATNHMPMVPAK